MSFEGYYQILCSNGHYSMVNVYAFNKKSWRCRHCGNPTRWTNTVDTTNGSWGENPDTGESERIDNYIDLEVAHIAPCCDKCGQSTGPCVYRVPEDVGTLLDIKAEEEDDNEFVGEDY